MASEGVRSGPMPIVSLLEDVDAYAGRVFDSSAKTIDELQRMEQVKRDLRKHVDWKKLDEREMLLTNFLRRIEGAQQKLTNMRSGDFPALSLVWGNGAGWSPCNRVDRCHADSVIGLVGQGLQDIITMLVDMERQILVLRENFDGGDRIGPTQSHNELADEFLARYMSLMEIENGGRAIRHRRDAHPCPAALRLIRGDDTGHVDRCLKKDLHPSELERLDRGGEHGTYLFWKCDNCEYRLKYYVSKSRTASLLSNEDDLVFKDSKIRCSRAFLAMSHLEQRERKRVSSSHGPPRYACMICTLHRPAAKPGRHHTFSTRDDYAKHLEDAHYDGSLPPTFILQKLGIEYNNELPDGKRRELWAA